MLQGTEINSSFHRPHRTTTYVRWAAETPAGFRFCVKLPREATHVARLHEPDTGRVRVDGHDLRDLTLESVRSQVSIVLQESVLFAMSVRDNIALGVDGDVSDEQVHDAARLAGAHEFVLALPHGYDTVDPFRIDPRLGDDADFQALVTAAHDRGLRVLLDGVFNHAGREFPPVARALAEGPGSASADWVRKLYDNDGLVTADYFEGHDTLVTLNHASPQVQQLVRDVMLHWLRRGIDGWRLDAAYAVPAEFWAAVLPAVRAEDGLVAVPPGGAGFEDDLAKRRLRRTS